MSNQFSSLEKEV